MPSHQNIRASLGREKIGIRDHWSFGMGLHLLHFFSKFELLGRSDPSRLLVFGIFQHRADRRW